MCACVCACVCVCVCARRLSVAAAKRAAAALRGGGGGGSGGGAEPVELIFKTKEQRIREEEAERRAFMSSTNPMNI